MDYKTYSFDEFHEAYKFNMVIIDAKIDDPGRYYSIENIINFSRAVKTLQPYFRNNNTNVPDAKREIFIECKNKFFKAVSVKVAEIINQLNPQLLAGHGAIPFVERTEEYNKMSTIAADLIRLLLPKFRRFPVMAAIQSPFDSVREYAIDSYDYMKKNNLDLYENLGKDVVDLIRLQKN